MATKNIVQVFGNEVKKEKIISLNNSPSQLFKPGAIVEYDSSGELVIGSRNQIVPAVPAIPGVYEITINSAAAIGDTIKITDKTYTCSDDGAGTGEFADGDEEAVAGALKLLLAAEATGDAAKYTWTVDGAVITATEKVGGVGGQPELVVTKVAETGTLTAVVDTKVPGVAEIPEYHTDKLPLMFLAQSSVNGFGFDVSANPGDQVPVLYPRTADEIVARICPIAGVTKGALLCRSDNGLVEVAEENDIAIGIALESIAASPAETKILMEVL